METTRALIPAPIRKVVEASAARAETEAEPLALTEAGPTVVTERAEQKSPDTGMALEKDAPEKAKTPIPEDFDFIIRHASEKRLSEEEIAEVKHYARELNEREIGSNIFLNDFGG
jgi:hypothetical protein